MNQDGRLVPLLRCGARTLQRGLTEIRFENMMNSMARCLPALKMKEQKTNSTGDESLRFPRRRGSQTKPNPEPWKESQASRPAKWMPNCWVAQSQWQAKMLPKMVCVLPLPVLSPLFLLILPKLKDAQTVDGLLACHGRFLIKAKGAQA